MKWRWILFILTVLFLGVVVSRFAQLQQLKSTLQQGQWGWVVAAFVSQMVYFTVFTSSYQAAFHTVGIETRTRDLIPVTLGSLFVNVVVPAGGAGGVALFAEDLSRRGKPAAGAATGVLLQLIADFAAFMIVLVPGMVYLSFEHQLKAYEIVAAVLLVLLTGGLTLILLLGIWQAAWLGRVFSWVQRVANWALALFRRPARLGEDWASKNIEEFNQAARAVANHPGRLTRTVAIAFVAHVLDITTLSLLFLAFRHPVGIGPLVAGYAVGILFWIISITPQGIGVVEGTMALAFTSLDIPGAVAATVVLSFRGLTFWLPLILGFFSVQRMRTARHGWSRFTETWGVPFAAILVALMGVVNVLSAVTPSLADRLRILEPYVPLAVRAGGHLTASLAGFALLLLAANLARRKRVAWLLALIVLAISAFSHLVKGLDYEEALLAAGLMALLWAMRGRFQARSDPPSIQQGLLVLAAAFLFTLAYGTAGFYLLDRHYSVNFGLWAAVGQTVVMFTQFYDPGLVPVTRFGRYFAASIYTVGGVTLTYAVAMLLRPVFIGGPPTPAERARARSIVEKFGRSSLARMVLFDDKHYFFSPGDSVIGYALGGRVAVALGDPIGPREDVLPSIRAFLELCRKNDWLPAFYQTLPDNLEAYKAAGLDALCIGQEAIINLETFSLEGKEAKALRSPVNKLTKAGYRFVMYPPPIPDPLLEELRDVSDEWLTLVHGSEKRFSLGWFEDNYIRSSPVGVVQTPEGWVSAFVNFLPEYQVDEITIDLMRHRQEMENGTMEFLFVSAFEWAREQCYHTFNLGLSSLAGVGDESGDPVIERILHFVYEHIDQFYNFKGLHEFKEKFRPEWSPRYLIYAGTANLAQSWLAVTRASTGGRLSF